MLAAAAICAASPAWAETSVPLVPPSRELRSYAAPEANQGVAVDRRHFYVIDNSHIGKYKITTGRKSGEWRGDPQAFPHLNSCGAIGRELICAASNFPATPMTSSIEIFDPRRMVHLRSIPLGRQPGSLTWVDRRNDAWWAVFANYDGRGGEAGRDHSHTVLVKFDDAWRPMQSWRFPPSVLSRFAPSSSSGGGWGPDGLLYVTGHDLPELYVLRLPAVGATLEHLATAPIQAHGQAIAWEQGRSRTLWGIVRAARRVVTMRIPPVSRRAP